MVDYIARDRWQDDRLAIAGPAPDRPAAWVVHYPGTPNTWQAPVDDDATIGYLRRLQKSYIRSRGYSLGYNWAVGLSGTIFEVRGHDLRCAANPGRKLGGDNYNRHSESILIVVAGQAGANDAQIAAANRLIATRAGWPVRVHCDVDYTACAGAAIIQQVRDNIIGHRPHPPQPIPSFTPSINAYQPPEHWSLYPLDSNKPTVKAGNISDHVTYLNDVLFFYCEAATRGDTFGADTYDKVVGLQTMFGVTVDGLVGSRETWPIIDYIVSVNVAPQPSIGDTDNTDVDVAKVKSCRYVVQRGDNPWSIGEALFGDGNYGVELFHINQFETFTTPGNVHTIEVPDVAGYSTLVQAGEGPINILNRIGVDRDQLDVFYLYNGGIDRVFHPGDRIWHPTRRPEMG